LRDVQILFRLQPKSATNHHFGSRLVFDHLGYLYITLGDRGDIWPQLRHRHEDRRRHAQTRHGPAAAAMNAAA